MTSGRTPTPTPTADPTLDGRHPVGAPGSRRRRRLLPAAVAALVVVSVVGSWLLLGRNTGATGSGSGSGSGGAGRRATSTVERRDLVERESFDGSLGYDDERPLVAGRPGMLTWIAEEGSTIRRGRQLYAVDAESVILLYGSVPLYRTIGPGAEGADVRQLQRNLRAMGYTDEGALEATGAFDGATADALRDWQEDLGAVQTGLLEPGDAVFFAGPRRMGAHQLEVGSAVAPGATVATVTATDRVVTVALPASDQDLVSEGERVVVTLPSGRRVAGRIERLGTVAETDAENPGAEPTVSMTIRLAGGVGTRLDRAPVDVEVETSRASDVLAVPVAALLALAEGGYALEVVDDPRGTHLVGVEVGAFADGWVEVSGPGIDEGTEVVVAG